jgi:hypothetical protein
MIMTKPALDNAMSFVALFQLALRSGAGAGIAVCAHARVLVQNATARADAGTSSEIRRRAEIRFTNNGGTSRVTLSSASAPSQLEQHRDRAKKQKTPAALRRAQTTSGRAQAREFAAALADATPRAAFRIRGRPR